MLSFKTKTTLCIGLLPTARSAGRNRSRNHSRSASPSGSFQEQQIQLLFATTTKLHCVDLLGRDVEEYPVTLPEATDVGVSVLDYDRNRNYRFLVAAGTKLYNYSSEGKRIEGWKTDAASERLVTAPELFQKNGKDYIVTSTATKPLILNRRGKSALKRPAPLLPTVVGQLKTMPFLTQSVLERKAKYSAKLGRFERYRYRSYG